MTNKTWIPGSGAAHLFIFGGFAAVMSAFAGMTQ